MAHFGSTDWLVEVARGRVEGAKVYVIVGRKDEISSTVLDDISQIPSTTVIPDPGGTQLEVVSSSGDDDGSPVGSGIRTLDLHYLDTPGDEQEETITMNGVTAVTTVATDISDIQWMHAKTVGAGGVAAGNIALRTVGGAGIDYEYISAGGDQSLGCHYHVPNGKIGYLLGWHCTAITKQIDFRLRATVERFDRTLLPGVFLFQDVMVLNDGSSPWVDLRGQGPLPAGATIKVSGLSAAAGGNAGAMFKILLIDNPG